MTESVLRIVTLTTLSVFVCFSVPVRPTQRPESVCERWRTSLIEHYGGKPEPQQYLPQCEPDGQFRYTPHYPDTAPVLVFFTKISLGICSEAQSSVTERPLTAGVWTRTVERLPEPDRMTSSNLPVSPLNMISCMCPCVQNVENLFLFFFVRSIVSPGLPSVAPPTVRPLPRPDVTPPPHADATILYAQGQKIGALPLNGTRLDETRARTLLTLHVRSTR